MWVICGDLGRKGCEIENRKCGYAGALTASQVTYVNKILSELMMIEQVLPGNVPPQMRSNREDGLFKKES